MHIFHVILNAIPPGFSGVLSI